MRDEQVADINLRIDAAVAEFVKAIPQQVHKLLTSAMCSALGLRNQFGDKYEVDNCNGREPLIAQFVKEAAIPEAKKVVTEIALAAIDNIRKNPQMVAGILAEAQKRYKEAFWESVVSLSIEKAKADAAALVNRVEPVLFEPVLGTPGELADPSTGSQSETAEALLARLAQDFISREEIARGHVPVVGTEAGVVAS